MPASVERESRRIAVGAALAVLAACRTSASPVGSPAEAAPTTALEAGPAPALAFAFVDVQAVGDMTCAAGSDGAVYTWGRGVERPTRVPGLHDVVQVGCLGDVTCGRDRDGGVACVAGVGARGAAKEPRQEKLTSLPRASDFVLTEEGGCAIASGDLWCWRRSRFTPEGPPIVERIDGARDVLRVRTNGDRTCVVRKRAPPLCVSAYPEPMAPKSTGRPGVGAALPPPHRAITEMVAFATARDVMPLRFPLGLCAVLVDGTTTCEAEMQRTALAAAVRGAAVRELFPGISDHLCARLESGDARCASVDPWDESPLIAPAPSLRAPTVLSVGDGHGCAVTGDGLSCWGAASDGQLGDGTPYHHARAQKVPGIVGAVAISVGRELTCAVLAAGSLWCWGAWEDEPSWHHRQRDRFAPAAVSVPTVATAVYSGTRLSKELCVRGDLGFWCENGGTWSKLAVPPASVRMLVSGALVTTSDHARKLEWDSGRVVVGGPHDLELAGVRLRSLAKDADCGVSVDGDIVCGHCGACDSAEARRKLTRIHGSQKFVQVASLLPGLDSLGSHVCGLTEGGTVECYRGGDIPWQRAERVELVDEATFAPLHDVAEIAAEGGVYSQNLLCARGKQGAVWCAGDNAFGQRGIGTTGTSPSSPLTPVLDLPPVVEIGVAGDHACGRTDGGDVYCWGNNARGAVPDGALGTREQPVRVALPAPGGAQR